MKFCTNCGEGLEDSVQICPKCGTPVADAAKNQNNASQPTPAPQPQPQPQPQAQQSQQGPQGFQPYMGGPQGGYQQQPMYAYDPADHTAEMDAQDIADNKILAITIYILGWAGMIVALLAARDSKFVGFHLRQMLKLEVLISLVVIVSLLLCWTFIVPIAGSIFAVVLFVVQIIGFVNACRGKAKELPIVSAFKFL